MAIGGVLLAGYEVQQPGSGFQYNAVKATIENIDLTSHAAPKIAVLEFLYNNVNITGGTVLLGTGEKLIPGDNEWKFAANITSSLGSIFTTTISDFSYPLLTEPISGGKSGWEITDVRVIVHAPTVSHECTNDNYITVT